MFNQQRTGSRLNLAVFMFIAAVLIFSLLAVRPDRPENERTSLEVRIAQSARAVRAKIASGMVSSIERLVELPEGWEQTGSSSEKQQAGARAYLASTAGAHSVVWMDASYDALWAVSATGLDLPQSSSVISQNRAALDAAVAGRRTVVTRAFDLPEGGKAFVVCVPRFDGAKLRGVLVGTFRGREALDGVLRNVAREYSISVFDGNSAIFRRGRAGERAGEWSQQAEVRLSGITWRVEVRPGQEVLEDSSFEGGD